MMEWRLVLEIALREKRVEARLALFKIHATYNTSDAGEDGHLDAIVD